MIHKFKMHGSNIVLDVNSNSVHLVDDIAYDILDYMDKPDDVVVSELLGKYTGVDIRETLAELRQLKAEGQLFSEDFMEEYLTEQGGFIDVRPGVKELCLHIAHDCNLRCRYCFASTGDFGTARTIIHA